MMHCNFSTRSLQFQSLLSAVNSRNSPSEYVPNFTFVKPRKVGSAAPALRVVARAGFSHSHCEPSSGSLNTPLEPRSEVGKYLSGLFLNQKQFFHEAVTKELELLAAKRDASLVLLSRDSGSDDDTLYRKIGQMKLQECHDDVEEVMYMLIISKFSEIRVPLVPKLSRCIYNNRLEIGPSKNWDLESIHNIEVLKMVKEYVSELIGLRVNSSVADNWATTEISRLHLAQSYAGSILYGYLLKSAFLRYHMERCLAKENQYDNETKAHCENLSSNELKNIVSGLKGNIQSAPSRRGSVWKEGLSEDFRWYLMGFDINAFRRSANPNSIEGIHLINKHCHALFWDDRTGPLNNDEMILTSFLSMKRLALEAIAFGSFLWDTERCVGSVFKLQEN
ncbi:hypothetical protein K2173_018476 [Erythroxylum novogranatense]|uniref:Uncharacterized protein n=1 Tax=Erythroxylum novogranatense TaxID=1862640 RepID=A0AAV8UDX4_9ROSI|nr:hypothetical protein K2173_018476 [Erythroxylum novogranatense]